MPCAVRAITPDLIACSAGTEDRVFFGDGVVYVSGVAANTSMEANAIVGNVLLGNPSLYGEGGPMYESL